MAKTTDPDIARTYVVAVTLVVFFVLWALVAMHPFPQSAVASQATPVVTTDPRLAALQRRELAYNHRRAHARRTIARRQARYRHDLRVRLAQNRRIARLNAMPAPVPQYVAPSAPSTYVPPVQVTHTTQPAPTHTASS